MRIAIDLAACRTEGERVLAYAIKARVDAAARGETKSIPMAEVWRAMKAMQAARARVLAEAGVAFTRAELDAEYEKLRARYR